MAFIAECPFCHLKQQGVPHDLAGSSSECPRCHNLFTLSVSVAAATEATSGPRRLGRRRAPLRKEKATASASPSDPEPLAPQRPLGDWTQLKPQPEATVTEPVSLAAPPPPEKPHSTSKPRTKNTLGIAALLAGGLAILVAAIPGSGGLCLLLAGVGLIFGMLGFVSWLLNNNGIGYAGAGLVVSMALLVVATFQPEWLGLTWQGLDSWGWDSSPQTLVLSGIAGRSSHVRIARSEWVDAGRGAIEKADFQVRIKSAIMKTVQIEREKSAPAKKSLVIELSVQNVGSRHPIEYRSWAEVYPGNVPVLKDNLGNSYRSVGSVTDVAERLPDGLLAPGKSFEDAIVFEAPTDGIEFLHLELPAAAIGLRGTFRLQIPRNMITSP